MNTLDARRRLLGRNVYKKTVEGNPAIAQGSLARRYPGITMQGWTEQAQYEGNQLFDASSAVDGIISNGEVVENGSFVTSDFISVIAGNVYSRSETGASGFFFYNADKTYLQNVTGTVNIEAPEGAAYVRFCINKNDFDIQDIMLNEGSTVLPYEPYTGGQPSPNPDYPQEIVSAGKYDEGMGKYQYTIKISDSEESPTKSQTVTLTADRPLTKWDKLEKHNGQWGWVYKSDEYTMTGEEVFYIASESYIGELTSDSYINVNNLQNLNQSQFGYYGFSNYLKIYVNVWSDEFDGVEGFAYNAKQIHVRISNEDTGVVVEDTTGEARDKIKAYCAQRYADGIPFIFWYETAEETFVPLTESEQVAMSTLHTNYPTTVLQNDQGCEMKLTYKTKKSLEVT